MVSVIENNIGLIAAVCRKRNVKALYLFGSAARATDFTENSDLDFLVEFNYKDKTDDNNLFERVENADTLKAELMKITNRDIDLVQERNIENKFLKYFINKEKKLVYGLS